MKFGLNLKFIFYTIFIVVFISLVFSVVFILQSRRALLHEFRKTGHALVENLTRDSEIALLIENIPALNSLAQNLMRQEEVQRVEVFDSAGRKLVALDKQRPLFAWEREVISLPVYFSPSEGAGIIEDMDLFLEQAEGFQDSPGYAIGQIIGRVDVLFSREGIIQSLNRIRWWIFVAATIAAGIGGVAALYFSRTLILPVQRLAGAASAIAQGNWDERLEGRRTDELGQLTQSFNIMAQSLAAKRDQLEQTYRELARKEKMAETGKFSMIIAHELKNPLGIIKGSVDILAKRSTGSDMRETMLGYIRDEVMRLNKLIDDFLSFARPTPVNTELISINDIAGKAGEFFPLAGKAEKNISLHLHLDATTPVRIDEHQIYQALLNLVNNAEQAMEAGGELHIATADVPGGVRIEVRDTGRGMPPEVLDKIFEPFYTTKAKGTGLGLSIVHKILENHGGRIDVTSSAAGTTVNLYLPA
jgi:signal transduction histidine kinase